MEEAKARAKMEKAFEQLKRVRKSYRKEDKEQARSAASSAAASASRTRRTKPAYASMPAVLEEEIARDGSIEGLWDETEDQATLWDNEVVSAFGIDYVKDVCEKAERVSSETSKSAFEAKIVTGKQRLEYRWKDLSPKWQEAFEKLILKALHHQAVSGRRKDNIIDPRKILTSRFVLTNTGKETLEEAKLKGRWIFAGNRDNDLGKYPTMAPTPSLLGTIS